MRKSGIVLGSLAAAFLALALAVEILVLAVVIARAPVRPAGEGRVSGARSEPSPFARFGLGGKTVAIVRVEETIYDARPIIRYLDRYAARKDVKAIVLRIESGGGSVAACQEIAARVRQIREGSDEMPGKVVISEISNIGASGAYYIAAGSDGIMCESGSLVGSIGVIYFAPNFEEMLKKVGITMEVVASGERKEAGGWYRGLRPDEREEIREIIMDAHGQFFRDVLAGRAGAITDATGNDDAAEELAKITDGRIMTGQMALSLGLVDAIGSTRDAIDWAADLAEIEGEPKILEENLDKKWSAFEEIFGIAFPRMGSLEILPRVPSGLYFLASS